MDELIWNPYPAVDAPVLFDSRQRRRLGSLFVETSQDQNRTPIFTLKDYEYRDLPSAYIMYMDSIDEADAAMKLVGSMAHWRKLINLDWFLNGSEKHSFAGLKQWRQDMAMRDASVGKAALLAAARGGNLTAASKLLDYATKGDIAGVEKPSKKKKPATRRGTQAEGTVVDLSSSFAHIAEKT